ncbi:MAG: glycosyltransferase [Deltaproteobacteria bacterium]|nr:glycosyltransferase [Deltaproteobacteria bacterium]
MPLVSVIMPVRDALPFLDEAVASVLGQSLEDLELVVVDDGSTDGSADRLRAWSGRDPRVRLLESPARGIVPALNHAVREARGALVARMDADDVCLPARLEVQADRLARRHGPDVVGCGAEVLSREPAPGLEAYLRWVASLTDPRAVRLGCLIESPLVHSGVMARRDLFGSHPYRTAREAKLAPGMPGHDGSTWPEDYDLWLRLLRQGARIENVPGPLVRVRWHPDKSTRAGGFTIAAMARLKLDHLLRTVLADGPPVVVQGAGRHGKMWLRMLRGCGIEVRALLDVSIRRQGRAIEGVAVLPVEDLPGVERALVIVAVGQKGPNTRRDEVRSQLGPMGLVEGQDYLFVC